MICAVADTHTIIWYLFADPRLSATAHNTIETVAQNRTYSVSKLRIS